MLVTPLATQSGLIETLSGNTVMCFLTLQPDVATVSSETDD